MAGRDLISGLASADLKHEASLAGSRPPLYGCGGSETITLLDRDSARITIRAQMACQGLVILNQTFYPGWQALIDERPARIEDADGALQSVVVGAGTHRVDFCYRPWTVYWGAC
jgi:uncharacterized membrane protein YfhO